MLFLRVAFLRPVFSQTPRPWSAPPIRFGRHTSVSLPGGATQRRVLLQHVGNSYRRKT